MKPRILATVFLLTVAACAEAPQAPAWTKRSFPAPAHKVLEAAEKAIKIQHHEITAEDPKARTISFHVGMTAWSWGYNMILTVTPAGDASDVSVDVKRSGGKAVSWGSGKKEVEKIYKWMDRCLSSSKPCSP